MRVLPIVVLGLLLMGLMVGMFRAMPDHEVGAESQYHYRMAETVAAGDWTPDPGKHLPYIVPGSSHPVDHDYGFHLVIAPFTDLENIAGGDQEAMKLAAICFAMISVLGLYALLRVMGAPWPLVLAVVPLALPGVFGRLLQLAGGAPMALGLMYWAYLLFWKRRPRASGLTIYLLMLCYHGAFLAAIFSLAGLGASMLRPGEKRLDPDLVKGVLWTFLGLLLALIINPYGPRSLGFLSSHLQTGWGDPAIYYAARSEFNVFSIDRLAQVPEYAAVFTLLLSLIVVSIRHRANITKSQWALLGIALMACILSWTSQHMVAYAVPFCILAIGCFLAGLHAVQIQRWATAAIIGFLGFFLIGRLFVFVYGESVDGLILSVFSMVGCMVVYVSRGPTPNIRNFRVWATAGLLLLLFQIATQAIQTTRQLGHTDPVPPENVQARGLMEEVEGDVALRDRGDLRLRSDHLLYSGVPVIGPIKKSAELP